MSNTFQIHHFADPFGSQEDLQNDVFEKFEDTWGASKDIDGMSDEERKIRNEKLGELGRIFEKEVENVLYEIEEEKGRETTRKNIAEKISQVVKAPSGFTPSKKSVVKGNKPTSEEIESATNEATMNEGLSEILSESYGSKEVTDKIEKEVRDRATKRVKYWVDTEEEYDPQKMCDD